MNTDQVEGNWKQLKGQVKQAWGKLTDDDIALLNGKSQEFFGKLQEKQGIAREQAEKQLAEFDKASGNVYSKSKTQKAA